MKRSNDFLYQQLADKLEQLIQSGVYTVGDKLPSVRALQREHRVSISTALQVYAALERKGWIAAREKSGYFVALSKSTRPQLPHPIPPPRNAALVRVNDLVYEVQKAHRLQGIISLETPAPPPELLPVGKLHKAMLQTIREHKEEYTSYDIPNGYDPLRKYIARRSLNWKGTVTSEEIIITNGAMEAINLCLRAVAKPGDTIALESPTFYGLLQTIESMGMKALEITTDPVTGIHLHELEDAFRKKKLQACLFMTNYSNPIGSCMPAANKKALAQLLRQYQVPLIEDDAYGDLHHGPDRPETVKTYDQDGLVLYCASFSKTIAPGYRIGWVMPGRYMQQVEQLKFMTSIHTSLLPQIAIHTYLENHRPDHAIKQLRQALAVQTLQMTQAIQQYFPRDIQMSSPAGGFSLWVVGPENTDAWIVHNKALEKGVSVTPGQLFSSRQKYRNCLRISTARQVDEDIHYALRIIGDKMKKMS